MEGIEYVGIVATLVILLSMCIKSTSEIGNIWMRALNTLGSIIYIVYGIFITSNSVIFLNCALVVVNVIFIIKSYKKLRGYIKNEKYKSN